MIYPHLEPGRLFFRAIGGLLALARKVELGETVGDVGMGAIPSGGEACQAILVSSVGKEAAAVGSKSEDACIRCHDAARAVLLPPRPPSSPGRWTCARLLL